MIPTSNSLQIKPVPKPLMVRSKSRFVFRIHKTTGAAITCGSYDAYCYSDPDPAVEYISYMDWCIMRNAYWDQQQKLGARPE